MLNNNLMRVIVDVHIFWALVDICPESDMIDWITSSPTVDRVPILLPS